MLLPLKSLRGGADSQRGRTGEALALRDDMRLLTLLRSKLDAEIELELLDECTNS